MNDERADLIEALGYLNATAKNIRRKGYQGIASDAYARQHERMNAILDTLEMAPQSAAATEPTRP